MFVNFVGTGTLWEASHIDSLWIQLLPISTILDFSYCSDICDIGRGTILNRKTGPSEDTIMSISKPQRLIQKE